MATPVNILIRAKDQASKVLKNVARSGAALTKSLTAMTGPLAVIAGAYVSFRTVGEAIGAAAENQERLSKFTTVFGEQTDAIKQWGDEFAGQVGRSKSEVMGFLASTQDLLVPLGVDEDMAAETSKIITKLSVDLASFNNQLDSKALEDIQAALTGSGEVMKKYGVIVNQTAVNQKLLSESIDPKNATEAQKAMARLNIIMEGTTAAQGDAIRTASSYTNQMKSLGAAFKDFLVSVATPWLDMLADMAGKVGRLLKMMGTWFTATEEGGTQVAVVSASIGKAFDWMIEKAVEFFSFFQTMWQEFPTMVELAVTSASLQIVKMGNVIKYYLLEVIWPHIKWFGENYFQIIKDTFSNVLTILSEAFQAYAQIFKRFWSWVFSGFKGGVGEFLGDVVNIGEEMAANIAEGLKNGAEQLPQIAARQMGPVEKELTNRVGKLGAQVGEAYAENLRKNREKMLGGIGGPGEELTLAGAGAVGGAMAAGGAAGSQQLAAVESRFLSGRGGGDPIKDQLNETKKQTEQQGTMIEYLADIAGQMADQLGLGIVT